MLNLLQNQDASWDEMKQKAVEIGKADMDIE